MTAILVPVAVIGGIGVVLGLGLGWAGVMFKVKVDERLAAIHEALPGANCGGCGYAGCDAFAAAVNEGIAKCNGCPVGGEETAQMVAEIMGVAAGAFHRKAAVVRCNGTNDYAADRYKYYGMVDCAAAGVLAMSGAKVCGYGCLGLGTCEKICAFGAIKLVNGVARVDKEKCTACGMCVSRCPRNIIELAPYSAETVVRCVSKDAGAAVRKYCKTGCLGCKICEKTCQEGAIKVNNNVAEIDYDKCVNCGACVSKCPTKAICDGKEGREENKASA